MSETTYGNSKAASFSPAHDALDDRMEQIRELLYGEFKRDSDARIALLEARVRELEAGLHRKLDSIQEGLARLSSEVKGDFDRQRRTDLGSLARNVAELGEQIRRLSET